MLESLQLAIEIKNYVQNEGRTLAISQGKMLKDSHKLFQEEFEKQTA